MRLLLLMLVGITTLTIASGSIYDNCEIYGICEPMKVKDQTNFSTITANASEIWITNEGNLDDVNSSQFENNAGTLSILDSFLQAISLWQTNGVTSLKIPQVVDMQGEIIAGVGDPVLGDEAANKDYVDNKSIESFPTSFSSGSIPYSDGNNLAEDNPNLYYDAVNKRLGVGGVPSEELHVQGTATTLAQIQSTIGTVGFYLVTGKGPGFNYLFSNDGDDFAVRADGTGGSPTFKLVRQSTSANPVSFAFDAPEGSFVLKDSGRVGINQLDPSYKLHATDVGQVALFECANGVASASQCVEFKNANGQIGYFGSIYGVNAFLANSSQGQFIVGADASFSGNTQSYISLNGQTSQTQFVAGFATSGNIEFYTPLLASVPSYKFNSTDAEFIFKEYQFDTTDADFNDNNIIGSGNISVNEFYAELWGVDIGQVSISSSGVYYNVTNVTLGEVNGFSFNESGSSCLRPHVNGRYLFTSQWSFSGGGNTEYHLAISINGTKQDDCHAERKIGSGGDVGSASFTCIASLYSSDKINLIIENMDNTFDPTIHNIQLTSLRVGDL